MEPSTVWWLHWSQSGQQRPAERFFSSLRSGLKTRACGGLDPLILCPFGTFVLTLVFSVRPPHGGVECGEARGWLLKETAEIVFGLIFRILHVNRTKTKLS